VTLGCELEVVAADPIDRSSIVEILKRARDEPSEREHVEHIEGREDHEREDVECLTQFGCLSDEPEGD
jgi:hypothetical protein